MGCMYFILWVNFNIIKRNCFFINEKISGGPGVVSRNICDIVSNENIDSVYVGSRCLLFPYRILVGSISWNVISKCDCNITIIKERKNSE